MHTRRGTLPADENALLGLPGIGRYTAAAVACFAFEQRVPLVDTNVRRVLGRVFGRPEPVSSRDAWELAGLALPEDAYSWNQALMDLGATICTSRNPACLLCPAFTGCATRGGGRQIAERRAADKTERFEGSNRYYRGRVVTALRALAPGDGLALDALGAAIRAGYSDEHRPWIETLVAALEADRLVRLHDGLVSLP